MDWTPARPDAMLVGRCGDHLERVLCVFTRVRQAYTVPGTVRHYWERHSAQFDVTRAEMLLASVLADPDAIYRGARKGTLIFVGEYDRRHYLVMPVKVLPDEMWLETVYVAERARFALRKWVRGGLVYSKQ